MTGRDDAGALFDAVSRQQGRKPRLLFVTAPFPPANRPGTPRTWNAAASLAQNGWDVTVLTVDPNQWVMRDDAALADAQLAKYGIKRIGVRNPWPWLTGGLLHSRISGAGIAGRVLRKVCTALQIETETGWMRAAWKASSAFRRGDFDVVLATVPPFGIAPLAMRIADRLGLPFVLDYRDLWTLNAMRRTQTRAVNVERRVLERAAAVTIVSPSAASLLREEFGIGEKVSVLTNGFRREDIGGVVPEHFDHFAIVYAGTFYAPKRSADPLFRALVRLEQDGRIKRDWRFHYYGRQSAYVEAAAERCGLRRERLVCHGSVERTAALAAVAGAGLVPVITSVYEEGDAADRGVVTGKVFEAIALARPMLVIAPRQSDIEPIVAEAGQGKVFQGTDIEGIASYIAGVANDPPAGVSGDPSAFEWTQLGRRLSSVMARAVLRPD